MFRFIGFIIVLLVFFSISNESKTQAKVSKNVHAKPEAHVTKANNWDCNQGICMTTELNYGATRAVIFEGTVGMLAPNSNCYSQTRPDYWGNTQVNGYNITWVSACTGDGYNFIYPKWDDGKQYVKNEFIKSSSVSIETGSDTFVFSAMGFTKALKQAY